LAGLLMFPVLYIVASVFGIGGGIVAGVLSGSLPAAEFMKGALEFFYPCDVLFGLIKAFVF